MKLTHIDLFSGIGGFSLAARWAGIETVQFVEIDSFCQKVLRKNFPGVPIYGDVKTFQYAGERPFIVAGGDPCPCRSKARSKWGSCHPDLSGYFLAVVARLRPQWVVRENVPASDDKDFCAALEAIGYGSVVVESNSLPITAQNRRRDFIVGTDDTVRLGSFRRHPVFNRDLRSNEQVSPSAPSCFCLTTHRNRYDSRDNFVWERERLRVLDSEERRRFSGFPDGWITGASKTRIAKVYGNSVTPQIAFQIMKAIIEVDENGSA